MAIIKTVVFAAQGRKDECRVRWAVITMPGSHFDGLGSSEIYSKDRVHSSGTPHSPFCSRLLDFEKRGRANVELAMHDQHIWPPVSYWSYSHVEADPCNHDLRMNHLGPIPGSHAAVSYAACNIFYQYKDRRIIRRDDCCLSLQPDRNEGNERVIRWTFEYVQACDGSTCVTRAEPHLRSEHVQAEVLYARLAFPPIHHAKRPKYPMITNNIPHPTQHYSQRDFQTLCRPVSAPGRLPSLPAGPVHP